MEVQFKAAPIRGFDRWELEGHTLITPSKKRIDLSNLKSAVFTDMYVNRMWASQFKLADPSTSVTLNCNDGNKFSDNRKTYFSFVMAIVDVIHASGSTVQIQRGPGKLFSYVFAAISVIPIGYGLYFIVDSIGSSDGAAFGIGMGIFFLLMGAFIIWAASPWQSIPMDSPAEFKDWFIQYLSGEFGR